MLNSLFLFLLLIGSVSLSTLDSEEEKGVCTSVECLRMAYEIKRSVDFAKDPCEGFYQFTCSGFLNGTR